MEGKDNKASSDPAAVATTAEFTSNSSWALGADDSDGAYFFSGGRESSILSEFGWNFEPQQPNRIGTDGRSDLAGGVGGAGLWIPSHSASAGSTEPADKAASTSNNQSVSSSSSEDLPEKSTGSDGKPPEIP